MKRPLKRRIRALRSKAVKAVTRGHGFTAYRLKLQAAKIAELVRECAQ